METFLGACKNIAFSIINVFPPKGSSNIVPKLKVTSFPVPKKQGPTPTSRKPERKRSEVESLVFFIHKKQGSSTGVEPKNQ